MTNVVLDNNTNTAIGVYKFADRKKPCLCVRKKGSITVDGISLTIAGINGNEIILAIIPHTYENTNLRTLKNGDFVNIETDITANYIEKILSTGDNKSRISLEFLQEHGF